MSSNSYHNKVVVITGGSSGIGLALAKEFAGEGARVVAVARNAQKLSEAKTLIEREIPGAEFDIFSADVSAEHEITATINQIGQKFGRIDVLINNAGIPTTGRFKDISPADLHHCLMVNYTGAVYTTKAAWPFLKQAKGQLSFVSSVAGYVGLIGYSAYAPTKFAMTGLAECLFFEGKDDNIRVSILYPPDTQTPLLEYEKATTLAESKALSKNIRVKTAEGVAKTYINGLRKNKFHIYCDVESRAVRWIKNNFFGLYVWYVNFVIKQSRKVKS